MVQEEDSEMHMRLRIKVSLSSICVRLSFLLRLFFSLSETSCSFLPPFFCPFLQGLLFLYFCPDQTWLMYHFRPPLLPVSFNFLVLLPSDPGSQFSVPSELLSTTVKAANLPFQFPLSSLGSLLNHPATFLGQPLCE